MTRPRWITLEGLNGVGKTHLCGRLAARLGERCVRLGELTDQPGDGLAGQVIAALGRSTDAFLRSGHPLTETFAFLALKVREHEALERAAPPGVRVVLEDRGVDTVAVYQAAILGGEAPLDALHALAKRISDAAARWRPLPDVTVLLLDDPAVCAARFERRLGRVLSTDERRVLQRVRELYALIAADEPQRVRVVDRRTRSEDDVLAELEALCASQEPVAGGDPCRT